jgi:hypothetical protein
MDLVIADIMPGCWITLSRPIVAAAVAVPQNKLTQSVLSGLAPSATSGNSWRL